MISSPFPGMDPYLEAKWPDVHASLIVYARNQINAQLPDDLQANIEEHLTVSVADQNDQSIRPDIHIAEEPDGSSLRPASGHVAVAEPLLLKRPPHLERHIEIVGSFGRVITAVEFISPWNKVGTRSREQYGRKQFSYLESGINLVEIDLVRQGSYVLAAPLEDIPEDQRTTYMICAFRQRLPDRFELYRAPLIEPLPNIPVPLRDRERDAVLQLQPLVDACYRDGRYHRINYQVDPKPKFDAEESTWIDARLRSEGRRA